MSTTVSSATSHRPARYTEKDCQVSDFAALIDQVTELADYPHAVDVQRNVLIYDAAALRGNDRLGRGPPGGRGRAGPALTDGPGVVAFKGAFADTTIVDRATAAFDRSSTRKRQPAAVTTTISPRPARTAGCGTRWRNWPFATRRRSSTTTATTSSR